MNVAVGVEEGTSVEDGGGVMAGGTVASALGDGIATGVGVVPQHGKSKARTEVMITSIPLPRQKVKA